MRQGTSRPLASVRSTTSFRRRPRATPVSRETLLWFVLTPALACAGCFLELKPPDGSADSSVTDADGSFSPGPVGSSSQQSSALDGSPQDASVQDVASQDVASDEGSVQKTIDAFVGDTADSFARGGTEASADVLTDQDEGRPPADAPCGVCAPGTSEACGTGGTQSCSAHCGWGPCSVPNTTGCSDLKRDGFVSTTAFPGIAGCLGDWGEVSMRAPKTGVACGNNLATRCAAPADLCAPGWHVCGTPPYGPTEISAKITNAQCTGEMTGTFLAALGDQECEPCSSTGFGAVACGTPIIQQNGSCVWAHATPWVGIISGHQNLCSDVYNTYPNTMGTLCCID